MQSAYGAFAPRLLLLLDVQRFHALHVRLRTYRRSQLPMLGESVFCFSLPFRAFIESSNKSIEHYGASRRGSRAAFAGQKMDEDNDKTEGHA